MMRIAACLATERGIEVCAPVHDAFLICAPIDRIDEEAAAMRAAMVEASRAVLDGFELRVDIDVVRFPDRYMDPRGTSDVGPGHGSDRQAPAISGGGVMAANRDPIDIEALRIDPADPTLVPKKADKTRKKKWERQYILFPWSWLDALDSNRARRNVAVGTIHTLRALADRWPEDQIDERHGGGSGGFARR